MTEPMKLIQGYLDGHLTLEQIQALQIWIQADTENAQTFARYCLLHSHIRDNFMEEDLQKSLGLSGLIHSDPMDTDVVSSELMLDSDTEQGKIQDIKRNAERQLQAFLEEQERLNPKPAPPSVRRLSLDWAKARRKMGAVASLCGRIAAGLAIFAGLALVLMAAVSALRPKPTVVACIAESVQAQWDQAPVSSQLYPGWMTLEEGYARIEFQNGAKVVLQAPAKIKLETAALMYMERGKLVARAEDDAIGFTVRTPGSMIEDLGTEFGVLVNRQGRSEAHVFEGEVELRSRSNPKKSHRLVENEACSADSSGGLSAVRPSQPSSFMRHVPSVYELAVLASGPSAYWRFDANSPTRLSNVCNPAVNAGAYAGSVRFVEGPDLGEGKKAMALQCDGQRSRASVQDMTAPIGEYTTGYTHVVWVRADVIRHQSILSTSHSDVSGGIRGLVMRSDGRFEHSLLGASANTVAAVVSETVAQPGQWYHIVVLRSAYDDRKLFVNGIEEDVAELSSAGAPRFQDVLCLGSIVEDQRTERMPQFKGALSEVALYNRALTAEEVRRLYRAATLRDVSREIEL